MFFYFKLCCCLLVSLLFLNVRLIFGLLFDDWMLLIYVVCSFFLFEEIVWEILLGFFRSFFILLYDMLFFKLL